jgi:hemolysin activation/secretion protein
LLLGRLDAIKGDHRTLKDLVAARDLIISAYRDAGYLLVDVGLPASIATDGIVTLSVVETTLQNIRLSGNQRFSDANMRRQLPGLIDGTPPNVTELTRNLFVANDNPARHVTVNFTTPTKGIVDADVQVQESNPLMFALIVDSSGIREIGRTLLSVGIRHANVFDRSHILDASYRTSPAYPDNVKVANLTYQIPLPALAARLQLSARYGDIDAGHVLNAFDVAGKFKQATINYHHDLKRDTVSRHGLDISLADKRYQPSVVFFGTNLFTDVNARPLGIAYQYSARHASHEFAFDLSYFRNLVVGSGNDDATYEASRTNARADWEKYRLNATYQYRWSGGWQARVHAIAQYSSEPLVDFERLFVGGLDTLRGLIQGELFGDRGYLANVELYTPMLANAHRFLVFIDSGRVSRVNVQPGDLSGDGATTWGVGWRYVRGKKAEMSLDWARVEKGTTLTPQGDNALNFRMVTRF